MATPSSSASSTSSVQGRNTSANKLNQVPNNVFGTNLTMNREDHEKERLKWLQKLEDAETRLAQTETINHEMNQLKAELNKKIIEMERNQKPLIEQNRKLAERNRLLQGEFKKCEHKLSHSQEDFLTLKDNYERLLKENTVLKEKRLFPEKLEELDRYKNQVLEYSKCITALRQAGIEKDRRYEILIHKFKLLRKAVSRRLGDADDDHQSSFGGSDCSAESSISLNTITEDLQETENNVSSLTANALLQERVITLQAKSDSLERQLNEAKETNELLEFQLLESKELMNQEHEKKPVEKIERSVETDRWIKNGENLESKISSEETIPEKSREILTDLSNLQRSANLFKEQREATARACLFVKSLEQRMVDIDNKLNETNGKVLKCENERKALLEEIKLKSKKLDSVEKENEELQKDITHLRNRITVLQKEALEHGAEKKLFDKEKEMFDTEIKRKQSEIVNEKRNTENLRRELEAATARHAKEVSDINRKRLEQSEIITDIQKQLKQAETDKQTLSDEVSTLRTKLVDADNTVKALREDIRPPIKSDLERRFEESKYRLKEALDMKHKTEEENQQLKKMNEELKISVDSKNAAESELKQLRIYTDQLEKQFSAQVKIIDALKDKIIQRKMLADCIALAMGNVQFNEAELETKFEFLRNTKMDEADRSFAENVRRLILRLLEPGQPMVPHRHEGPSVRPKSRPLAKTISDVRL